MKTLGTCVLKKPKGRTTKEQSKRIVKYGTCSFINYTGYIGMCGPKGYGFSSVLAINGVSILPILIIKKGMVFAL